MQKYRTILIDPPWKQPMIKNTFARRKFTATSLPYPTMELRDIKNLPVGELAEIGCHLWLWTTNWFLRDGFDCLDSWGFNYLAPITWRKPSGVGCWFVHVTQTLLFGYYGTCKFNRARFLPTVFDARAGKHSTKPEASYELIEKVSDSPRLEMFARRPRLGWDVWGDEVESNIDLQLKNHNASVSPKTTL